MGKNTARLLSDGVYHVYNRDLGRAMILSTNDEKTLFADLIHKTLEFLPQNVYYSSYSKAFCARRRRDCGPLWQGRYKSST